MRSGKKRVRPKIESERYAKDEYGAEESGNDESNQVPAIVFPAQAVAQDLPAKSGDKTDLSPQTGNSRYISHESSSSWGLSAPRWPTIERKICSSVVLVPSSPAIPARSSSREPCAASRPL